MVTQPSGRTGYRLEAAEVERLCAAMDIGRTGWLAKSQLAASQIDWQALQARLHSWSLAYQIIQLLGSGGFVPAVMTSWRCRSVSFCCLLGKCERGLYLLRQAWCEGCCRAHLKTH